MSSCISTVLCCAGNCICQGISNICEDSKKINHKVFSRIGYMTLSILGLAFSLIVLFFGAGILKPFNDYIRCPKDENFSCLGISSVYRMSLSLVVMHVVVMFFSLCTRNCAKVVNNDCWTFKFFLLFGTYFGFFFVSNSFFSVYAQIARYLSLLFLLYQLLVTVSFAHVINIQLVSGLDRGNDCKYKFWLIFLSLLFLGIAFYWIIQAYIDFSSHFYNIIITTLTVIFGVGFTVLSISSIVNRKRLLTSIYLFSFISYLSWSALNSQPSDKVREDKNKFSIIDISVGFFYLFLALCFLGFYVKKKNVRQEMTEEQKALNNNPLLVQESVKKDQELMNRDEEEENKEDEVDQSPAFFYFHIFMIFMAIYYCMLLTNWNVIDPNTQSPDLLTQNWTSFWVKICALILTVLLYTWVLLAPVLFPDREFDF